MDFESRVGELRDHPAELSHYLAGVFDGLLRRTPDGVRPQVQEGLLRAALEFDMTEPSGLLGSLVGAVSRALPTDVEDKHIRRRIATVRGRSAD